MSQEEIGQRSTDETPRSSDFVDRASEHTAISPELVVGERPSSKSRGVKLLLFLMLVVVMGCVIYYLLGQYIVDVEPSATSGALTSVIKINRPDSPVIPLEEGVKVEIVPVEKLASVEPSPPRVAASNPEVDPVPMVVAPAKAVGTPAYVLASGRYLYSDKLNKAISQIEKMGYKTTRTSINEEHKMTRLLLNRFDTKAMGNAGAQVSFIGHGIGVEIDEFPFIARGFDDQLLEEKMCFAFEPKAVFVGEGAVGIENTFWVEADGLRRLTYSDEQLVEL